MPESLAPLRASRAAIDRVNLRAWAKMEKRIRDLELLVYWLADENMTGAANAARLRVQTRVRKGTGP